MTDKVVLSNVLGTYDVTKINANFDAIKDVLDNKVVFRDNPTGTPNSMKSNLDMNGNRLINLPPPVSDNEPLRRGDVLPNVIIDSVRATPIVVVYSGDGINKTFTLPYEVLGSAYVDVHIGTAYQHKNTFIAEGTTLLFNAAPPVGVGNIEVYLQSVLPLAYGEAASTVFLKETGERSNVQIALTETDARHSAYVGAGSSVVAFTQDGGGVPRTVRDKLREEVTVKDYGAVADVGGNQSPLFAKAVAQAILFKQGTVPVPIGNWRLTDEITLSKATGFLGSQAATSIVTMEGAGDYGINISGAGLGGSATDGIEVGKLNLWGSKDTALIRVHGTGLFRLHDLMAQNNTKGSIVRFTSSQDGTFDHFDFLACGGATPATPQVGAVVYYGPGCNNIYTRYGRFEAPRNTAIYVDGADTIRYLGGKIDGSFGGASLTVNPFVVVANGDISFSDFTVTGFKSYPFEVVGTGKIDYKGSIGNGLAPALFKSTSAAYNLFLTSGGLPGVIYKPSVKFRGTVGFSSQNTTNNKITSVISLLAPDPLMKPGLGNGKVQITGAFDTGGGLFQAAIKEWNGTAFAAPVANDRYTGGWLVDRTTGNAFAQIVTQSGGLVQFRTTGLTSTGSEHFIQYNNVHGVPVDIEIDAPAFSQSRWTTRLVELKTTVTTTGAVYDAATGYTAVQLSAAQTNNALIGCFLWNKTSDVYYYIAANSDTQLTVMHDRAAAITNGSYEVVIGNPKAGRGIAINWY